MGRETQGSPAGEQKLERYGVWVKVEPRTVAESQGAESSFELTDLESSSAGGPSRESSQESTLTLEEEKLLDELDTELGPSDAGKELSVPEEEPLLAEEEELPDISEMADVGQSVGSAAGPVSDEELPELELEEEPVQAPATGSARRGAAPAEANEVEVTLSETGSGLGRFEDLDALESELATVAASSGKPAASPEILARIEEELRSIRADLTQLRNELSGMRKSGAEPAVAEPPTEAQGGFFDEDEDETIALTGDELDNILNTAEITEEAAEAAPVEEPEEAEEVTEIAEEKTGDEIEELPAELELEDLSSVTSTPTPVSAPAEALPELDLEGIPEIETAESGVEAAEEVGELETLDLEEGASSVESIPEGSSDIELLDEKPATEKKGALEHAEELAGEVDLEALAAEAEELGGEESTAPVEDLEIGELEPVSEEAGSASGDQKEIEIAFESEQPAGRTAESESADEVLELEEVPAEEKAEAPKPAAKGGGAVSIPDDLKDEIRTVLKYMDDLLDALPQEKIKEFAESEYFVMYQKLFEDLGLGE